MTEERVFPTRETTQVKHTVHEDSLLERAASYCNCIVDWLEKKKARFEAEKKQDDRLKKTLASELEWVRSNPKARQTKSKARMDRYEEMLNTPAKESIAHTASIYIPPGPRSALFAEIRI